MAWFGGRASIACAPPAHDTNYCALCGDVYPHSGPCQGLGWSCPGCKLAESRKRAVEALRQPYPCRHPGCFATASLFAVSHAARYGHVCRHCHADMPQAEQEHYAPENVIV